jgi:hypothetical protein
VGNSGDEGEAARFGTSLRPGRREVCLFVLELAAFADPTLGFDRAFVADPGIESMGPTSSAYVVVAKEVGLTRFARCG